MSKVSRPMVPAARYFLSILKTVPLYKCTLNGTEPHDTHTSQEIGSSGLELSSPGTLAISTKFLPLNLPQFPSLEEEILASRTSLNLDKEPAHTDFAIHEQTSRDDVIEGLLDQIATLRQKVRAFGDDNSRLRRELMRKRSQESKLYGMRIVALERWYTAHSVLSKMTYLESSHSHSHDQPGANSNDLRPLLHHCTPQEGDMKTESPKGSELSAYSYYRNSEYSPAYHPARRRAVTVSTHPNYTFSTSGSINRQRCHSLLTPKQLTLYSESHTKEEDKLELSSHVRRAISLRFPEPAEQEASTYSSEDIILPHLWLPDEELTSSNHDAHGSQFFKPAMSHSLRRRPQSRVRLWPPEAIFRCFSCSQRFNHCNYGESIWIMDHEIRFGYFETYSYAALSWLLSSSLSGRHASSDHGHVTDSEDELSPRHFIGNLLDEVDDSPTDESPSAQLFPGPGNSSTVPSQAHFYTNGYFIPDAQRRRERHIALLDSIVEEEELEETSSSELSEASASPLPTPTEFQRPMIVSKSTQSTLASIPEHEDSTDSTVSTCPPLTDETGSSSARESRRSMATFDDFEDLDFEMAMSSAGSDDSARSTTSPSPSEVNTVPFPGKKLPLERTSWWKKMTPGPT